MGGQDLAGIRARIRDQLISLAEGELHGCWRSMRDDAGEAAAAQLRGYIFACWQLGVFDDDRAELWRHRIQTCPGHDDEGGRSWCAYCGDFSPPGEG